MPTQALSYIVAYDDISSFTLCSVTHIIALDIHSLIVASSIKAQHYFYVWFQLDTSMGILNSWKKDVYIISIVDESESLIYLETCHPPLWHYTMYFNHIVTSCP